MAWKILRAGSGKPEMSTLALRRNRAPMGGAPVAEPAVWEAGNT